MSPRKSKKMKTSHTPDLSEHLSPQISGFANLLHRSGEPCAITSILELLRIIGVSLGDIKKFQQSSPSFSGAKWQDVAEKFNLNADGGVSQLDQFTVKSAALPPSFHKTTMVSSVKHTDVYQERDFREAARMRLMEAWHVPIIALFQGRLIDKPESSMPGSKATSGGEVDHEICMIYGILLLLIEMKLHLKEEKDCIAQTFLELSSAYERNRGRDLQPPPAVYAILTDLQTFYFFRYDGTSFTYSSTILVRHVSRDKTLFGMFRVSELLFSILLQSYIDMLTAISKRSHLRAACGDNSKPSSAAQAKPTPRMRIELLNEVQEERASSEDWDLALEAALTAQGILVNCDRTTPETWEREGGEGLMHLARSVRYLEKVGSEEWDEHQLETQVNALLFSIPETLQHLEATRNLV